MLISPGDKWKTVFSATSGHYEYCIIPYGLSCAPSVFQCLTNDMLRDMLGKFVIAYIDDILIYSYPQKAILTIQNKCCPIYLKINFC